MSDITNFNIDIVNPPFNKLGYVIGVANLQDKHDRSAPSDYHWKIFKCRIIIFSHSSILASPEDSDIKQIHIIFNKNGDDYDKLHGFFKKFYLTQAGDIRDVTVDIYAKCFQYTMLAKIAPTWNKLGSFYLINNRNFLTTDGPQDGIYYLITCSENKIRLQIRPIRVTLMRSKYEMSSGELVKVLPSLNKAVIEDSCKELPKDTVFKSYKDLKRHWKNIHGYRLPEEEGPYYLVRFWRGEPLTYPQICVTGQMPVVVPIPKKEGREITTRFVNSLRNKWDSYLGEPINIMCSALDDTYYQHNADPITLDTQAITFCTPTPKRFKYADTKKQY